MSLRCCGLVPPSNDLQNALVVNDQICGQRSNIISAGLACRTERRKFLDSYILDRTIGQISFFRRFSDDFRSRVGGLLASSDYLILLILLCFS